MEILSIHEPAALGRAISLLEGGRLVAFPTETVYGLGGDAENDRAVAAIFEAKGRPAFNPLILHIGEAAQAERYARVSGAAQRLIEVFWPGPLTLVLPRREGAPSSLLASAGLDSVALRLPDHAFARAMLRAFGRAVAAPSANRSGRISPTRAAHVGAEFGESGENSKEPALILDGGDCAVGLESTIVDLTGEQPRLLRPGAIDLPRLREVLPEVRMAGGASKIVAPGMLASHYAPRSPVRLNAARAEEGEALLAFGPGAPAHAIWRNLSRTADLREAAANLFAFLRELDRPGEIRGIAVMPIPENGLGIALNDRLRRAAAPRDEHAGQPGKNT